MQMLKMTPKLICLLIVILGGLHCAHSANILFWFTGGTYSHDIPIWPLAVQLADRNHSITWYSPYKRKPWEDARIKIVVPPKIQEINNRYLSSDKFTVRLKNLPFWSGATKWSYETCEYFLTLDENDKSENNVLWNNGNKFDLVVIDSIICDCGHIIAHYHNAKVIVSDSSPAMPWYHHIYGFPAESSWLPGTLTNFQYPMSFRNLIENYLDPWYWTYIRRTQLYPKLDALIQKVFKGKKDIPSFLEMERKADLIFVNTHASVELNVSRISSCILENIMPIVSFTKFADDYASRVEARKVSQLLRIGKKHEFNFCQHTHTAQKVLVLRINRNHF